MGVPSPMTSSKYTPKASDDASLDSATTIADKNETKLVSSTSSSRAKRASNRRSALSLRRPVLVADSSASPSGSPSACHIRHRYLSKLGVADMNASLGSKQLKPMPVGVLKTSANNHSKPANKSNVRFQTQVSIQFIPDKRGLNNREDLWIQKEEFTELFQRNCLEYAADGWSWENATEESDFVCYKNELVHPAHFRNACTMQRHFLMNMYAQRQSG